MTRDWPARVPGHIISRSTEVGLATMLFWSAGLDPLYAWVVRLHLLPAIQLRQIRFDFDERGSPSAVVAWAYLSDDVAREMTENPRRALHRSEWNEGANPWIVAAFGHATHVAGLLRKMLREEFRDAAEVRGFQRQRDGSIRRLRTWRHARPAAANRRD